MNHIERRKNMERIVFDKMRADSNYHFILNVHLQAYWYAHKFVYNKSVIDAACGTCFGTMIFSTAAKRIVAVDKDRKSMDYGKRKLPFFCPVRFLKADLEKDKLPKADICVSIETIEHLGNKFFLENLKTKELFYTIPTNMPIDENGFHKITFDSAGEVVAYIESAGWKNKFHLVGDNNSIFGLAERV